MTDKAEIDTSPFSMIHTEVEDAYSETIKALSYFREQRQAAEEQVRYFNRQAEHYAQAIKDLEITQRQLAETLDSLKQAHEATAK